MWLAREAGLIMNGFQWVFSNFSIHSWTDKVLARGTWKGLAPTFLVCGNRSHFYMPRWTDCGWMEVVTLLSWQYPFSEDTFDMHKLTYRVDRISESDHQKSWRRGQLRLRCRQNLSPTCIPCRQNWPTSANAVASRMNYRERATFR